MQAATSMSELRWVQAGKIRRSCHGIVRLHSSFRISSCRALKSARGDDCRTTERVRAFILENKLARIILSNSSRIGLHGDRCRILGDGLGWSRFNRGVDCRGAQGQVGSTERTPDGRVRAKRFVSSANRTTRLTDDLARHNGRHGSEENA